ncbi:MAG: hypothetical protein IJV35_05605 [Neisseriaceae bacterium]|nr:hypothetical protein [Neisseriaceae bacterium]
MSCLIMDKNRLFYACFAFSGSLKEKTVSLRDFFVRKNRGNPIKNRKIFYQRRKALYSQFRPKAGKAAKPQIV